MKPVAIIGAGITGLTAAFYLKRKGVPVTVYEASGRVGGVIQSERREGFLAEFGPNTILETSPKVRQLVIDAGLQSRRLDPDPKAEARFVVRYQRPVEMPGSPPGFLTTDLFSWKAKLAVLREPFIKPRRDGVEESIAQFVVRRFNQEFLDHAIDALVAGIYAGDPYKLSVTHAFPKLKALEDNYGSMIKGQILGARERKKRGEVAKDRAPKFSFDEGLQVLPDALAAQFGDAVRLNTRVTKIAKRADDWQIDISEGTGKRGSEPGIQAGGSRTASSVNATVEHSAVIYCGTAFQLAELETEGVPALNLPKLAEVRYPPVASVVFGFRREDVAHPACGFGMLIPKIEGFKILGTIFSSALFPNRAPAGHLTLTSYVGGERYPELAARSPEELYALTLADLRVLLGIRGEPVFRNVVLYPRAIPQYNVGYGVYRELLSDAEKKAPGLYFAGHYRDGVPLSDSIVSGCNIAERVEKSLKHE